MGVLKVLGFAGEGVVDGVFEVGHLREAADGDLMLLTSFQTGSMSDCSGQYRAR